MKWVATVPLVCGALGLPGCIVNHDVLAAHDGTGGSGGTHGTGGASYGGSGTGGGGGVTADAAPDGAADGGSEPGTRRLTLLHGVTDAETVFFCFTTVSGTTETPLAGGPTPPSGLAFGHHVTLASLSGADLVTDALRVYVVAAAAADVAGLDCPALIATLTPTSLSILDGGGALDGATDGARDASLHLDAGSAPDALASDASTSVDAGRRDAAVDAARDASLPIPRVRVAALPVIPGGAFALARSYLLVAGGCLGGPGVTDPSERSVCGGGYSADSPTLTPYLVTLSPVTKASHVSLQFVNGTPALGRADLVLVPTGGKDPINVASDVPAGGIRPVPPQTSAVEAEIGALSSDSAVRIVPSGTGTAAYEEPWRATLASGGVANVVNDTGYTLVLVGPYPSFGKGGFWNAALVTIVPNAP